MLNIGQYQSGELTDTVADIVRSPATRTDDWIAVSSLVVETVTLWTGAWNAAERAWDVVTFPRDATVVCPQSALVVVCNHHQYYTV